MSRNSPPPLAKVTRPLLYGAVPRERLFARLDAERSRRRAVCVVGPPGAGKTTLVASWLDARQVRGIWYQVDPGDADVATFFHYLGQALRGVSGRAARPMPALTAEYRADVAGFSRRFFRSLFGRLPAGSALVLDNYQEVPSEDAFHSLVAEAVEEVPPGSLLVVVSRRDPPDCYSRLVANENVGFVDADDLTLTEAETRLITQSRMPDLPASDIALLHARSGGWAAGLTLMLEQRRRHGSLLAPAGADREATFRYFAAHIFDRLPEEIRRFLVASAYLPQVIVSVAQDLTGDPKTAEILGDLGRRHLFTHQRPGTEPAYWYHALFREFLLSRAAAVLGEEEAAASQKRAARLLEARAHYEDAFSLFVGVEDWVSAARLIERRASDLLATGRAETLREWIAALPQAVTAGNSWLQYWRGVALIPVAPSAARAPLTRAVDGFRFAGDPLGEALACAGMVETYYFEWTDFKPMRLWVDAMVPLLDRLHFGDDVVRELKIYSTLLVGVLYAAPAHEVRHRCVARVTEMLDEDLGAAAKMSAALSLLSYCNLACDLPRAQLVIRKATPMLSHEEVTPALRMWWETRYGHSLQILGDYAGAASALERSDEIADAHGLARIGLRNMLTISYLQLVMASRHDLRGIQRQHERALESAVDEHPMSGWHVHKSHCFLEAVRRNHKGLRHWARATAEVAERTGMVYLVVLACAHECCALAMLNLDSEFRALASKLRRLVRDSCFAFYEYEVELLESMLLLRSATPEAGRMKLGECLQRARAAGYLFPELFRSTQACAMVLAEALEADLETEYVVSVIQRLSIRPPVDWRPLRWPWPVRIRMLGRFEIEVQGEVLTFSGKAPKRSLTLLKAIIALGGRDVPVSRLVDLLWSDEEADASHKAAEVALVRLRRLLGHAEVVTVTEERATLDARLVWVDAEAFEQSAADALERLAQGRASEARLWGAIDLYGGDFMAGGEDASWTLPLKLRLHALFVRLIRAVGEHLEAAGAVDRAANCYERGLAVDPLIESFYQGLMRCHRAQGRHAEGIAVFRRLREALSIMLSIPPSEESLALARNLGESRRGDSTEDPSMSNGSKGPS